MRALEQVHTIKFETEDEIKIETIYHVLKEELPPQFFYNVTMIRGIENR